MSYLTYLKTRIEPLSENQDGLSLTEVLVAMFILAIISIGIVNVLISTVATDQLNSQFLAATHLAEQYNSNVEVNLDYQVVNGYFSWPGNTTLPTQYQTIANTKYSIVTKLTQCPNKPFVEFNLDTVVGWGAQTGGGYAHSFEIATDYVPPDNANIGQCP